MLKKSMRLNTQSFHWTRRKAQKFVSGSFCFLYKTSSQTRCSVVGTKKIFRKAVHRNRYRRIVYEIFRENFSQKLAGLSVVCLYRGTQSDFSSVTATNAIKLFFTSCCK